MTDIKNNGSVAVGELVRDLNISGETARRDLLILEKKGKLKRMHGGAVGLGETLQYKDYSLRIEENEDEKRSIARIAAELVDDGDCIAVDSGSTAVFFCRYIKGKFKNLTVITYCMKVFEELKDDEDITVILTGGTYSGRDLAFLGSMAENALRNYHFSKCFICPDAISLDHGLSVHVEAFVPLERRLMAQSDKTVVLADSKKFEQCALNRVSELKESFLFLTDGGLPQYILDEYSERGLEIQKGQ